MIFDSYLILPEGIPSKSIVHLSKFPHFSLEFCPCQALAGKDYDLIYDCVGTPEDWPKAAKVLKKGGGCRWRQFFPSWEWNINIFLKMGHTNGGYFNGGFSETGEIFGNTLGFSKNCRDFWDLFPCPCSLSIDGLTFVEVLSNTSFFRRYFLFRANISNHCNHP